MNCKKISFILLSALPIIAYGAQQHPWKVRAVPVAYNKKTKEWSILLGHGTSEYWNDFGTQARRGEDMHKAAGRALNDQTNGVYKLPAAVTPWIRDASTGDVYHFVPVKFIPSKKLYQKVKSNQKNDFVWIPASELAKSTGDISRPHRNQQVNVSREFLTFFRNNWSKIEQKLNSFISSSPA